VSGRPRVFVTRPILDEGLAVLRDAGCEVDVWQDDLPPSRADLLARVRGASGVLALLTERIDAGVMDAAGPGLRVVSVHAVGVDNVDVAEATRRGIVVTNTPDVLTETTADFAFALLMAAARRIPEGIDVVRRGEWRTWGPKVLLGTDVHGGTLGVVGFGRIGRAVARRASGFAMRVLRHDPGLPAGPADAEVGATRCEDLRDLLVASDFVSIHVPYGPATHHLIGDAALEAMRPHAILVNTSRGPVVDTDALVRALAAGRIGGAALDVTDPEPLPPDHPLLSFPGCLVVPHVASASRATRTRMSVLAARNLVAVLRGERPPHAVNDEMVARAVALALDRNRGRL